MSRTLFIHTSSILGGSEKAFLDLVDQYPKSELGDAFFVLPAEGPLKESLLGHGISVRRISIIVWPEKFGRTSRKYPGWSFVWAALSVVGLAKYLFNLRSFIKRNQISLVYSNGIKCHVLTSVLKSHTAFKLVWHLQDFFPHLRVVDAFLRVFGTVPDVVIANSKTVLEDFLQHLPGAWKVPVSRVVHNSVNPQEFLPRQKLSKNPLIISLVAMLTPWKGQEVFIDAIDLVRTALPNVEIRAWIVGGEVYRTAGESGYASKLQNIIDQKQLGAIVELKGLITDVQSIYNASEIVVHCSTKPEPFGRVIVEAMSSECAVIASRAGGVVEIIESERDGLLVEPNSPAKLADAIIRLITDNDFRARLATEGRKTVIQKFSSEKYARDIFGELKVLS